MDPDKIEALATGLLKISDGIDMPFLELVDRMKRAGILDDEEATAAIEFTGG